MSAVFPGNDLVGDGEAVPGQQHPDHDLDPVGPVVVGVAELRQPFRTPALEVGRGRVPQDQVKLEAEEVPDPGVKGGLDPVLVVRQEAQGPVEVVETEPSPLGPVDGLHPLARPELHQPPEDGRKPDLLPEPAEVHKGFRAPWHRKPASVVKPKLEDKPLGSRCGRASRERRRETEAGNLLASARPTPAGAASESLHKGSGSPQGIPLEDNQSVSQV